MSHENLDLAELLHRLGYRMTPQRQMVLDSLCAAEGHATPEQVYELVQRRSDAVNRATIYRTLKFLAEVGVVTTTISVDGQTMFEVAGSNRHHHLVCHGCGRDIEVSDELYGYFLGRIRERYGFEADTTHLTLTGLCADCRSEGAR